MNYVVFKRRKRLPQNPVKGTFYWIDDTSESESENISEIWFCSSNGLVRIDNYFTDEDIEELVTRLEGAESDIENIVNNKLTWKII